MNLNVFDVHGRLVRALVKDQAARGARDVVWDGRDDDGRAVASGVYFYRLELGGNTVTRRMTLLK
ncbi:MAG: T9SS type A sorting domain-containing protein [Candidatus Krumholzibacteria bacterium]|nr:T9SS type A sorting domain-containing protein [Candidatus Krumholzibacteria bacterium]